MLSLCLLFYLSLAGHASAGYLQGSEAYYLSDFDAIVSSSYAAVDDSRPSNPNAPSDDLLAQCRDIGAISSNPNPTEVTVAAAAGADGFVSASSVATQCGSDTLCIIPPGIKLAMDSNLNLGALIVRGSLYWRDIDQTSSSQYLCAGYVAIENYGAFIMNLQGKAAWIYIKDNGMTHPILRSRSFGAVVEHGEMGSPTVDITGRNLVRTWSLLNNAFLHGQTSMKMLHSPVRMGWRVGDRVGIAPTKPQSTGTGQSFRILSMSDDGTITLDGGANDDYDADFLPPPAITKARDGAAALMSAEVVNLSRNIVITGDDFKNIPCDPNLVSPSTEGCSCSSFRTTCTMGLHTAIMHGGVSRIRNVRVEKCGQRGVEGKYCLHLHKLHSCPDCLFENNAIENSHQRGIIVHGTHRSKVENNVLYNVRGAGIYIEDGNEMQNQIKHNVYICPYRLSDPIYNGCTVPGTSNSQSDTSVNHAGIYTISATNDLIGNRVSNSFNGMLLEAGGLGRGEAYDKVCESDARFGRWEGNTFHGHGRFGTYTLGDNYPKETDQSVATNGFNINKDLCDGFDAQGETNGIPAVIRNNFDYGNAFVGHYNAGDIQYNGHTSIRNNNLIYWKETKNFQDGCSAHIVNGYYSRGNMGLPDQGTFIIEDTTFDGDVILEANHHCNVGVTGVLCFPQYIFHNVKWTNGRGGNWIWFQNFNTQDHSANQNHGGVFTLSPEAAEHHIQSGLEVKDSIFPPGYVSLVSSHYAYLLSAPDDICVSSSFIGYGDRYDNGILCKVPLRALKIYSRNQLSGNAPPIFVELWFDEFGVVSQTINQPTASQNIAFHQIGRDNESPKQGYSFPVIPGFTQSYRVSLASGDGNIPSDWVIEFSDPVMGNRWGVEYVQLVVTGRDCGANGVVSSNHDRRYIWSGDNFIKEEAWGRHGACVTSADPPADMALVDCSNMKGIEGLESLECPNLCPTSCNEENSFCHCGTGTCQCKQGFSGEDCSIDLCAAARCSDHGTCAARYLGDSPALPVTSIDHACICDEGWSGPLCDVNSCESKMCSGNGKCVADGYEAVCICNEGYSGENCEVSCVGICSGGGGVYPFGCATSLNGVVKYQCGPSGGCAYDTDHSTPDNAGWCTYRTVSLQETCTCISNNDCEFVAPCNPDGSCPGATEKPDGTPCNSVPFGVCKSGSCTGPPTFPTTKPTHKPTTLALTSIPTKAPGFGSPTRLPSTDAPILLAVSAEASSEEAPPLSAGNAIDQDVSTRWSSEHSDPQWLAVDLGETYLLSSVELDWEAAYGSAYLIETSEDGVTWTSVFEEVAGSGGVDTIDINSSGRFVRMYGISRGTTWGYSLHEVVIRGWVNPTGRPTETPTKAPTRIPTRLPSHAPTPATEDYSCGCASCTQFALGSLANDSNGVFSCGERIDWLQSALGYSERDACISVGNIEFPVVCGPCDPLRCNPSVLIWSDEFDIDGRPDPNKWAYDIGGTGWGNDELQYYTDRVQNAFVKDGILSVRAVKENYFGSFYTSARLVTRGIADWTYGRIQVRARLRQCIGLGTWPAIWMLPTEWHYGGWPASGEIDIMEHVGYDTGNIHGTVHTEAFNHMIGTQMGSSISTSVADWHVYEIVWNTDRIDFLLDGMRYHEFQKEKAGSYKEWPFDRKFHLLLNVAVGGSWGGAQGVDAAAFEGSGQTMEVDFVRVYSL